MATVSHLIHSQTAGLHGDWRLDGWMRVVIFQSEVFKLEGEQVFHIGVNAHMRQGTWRTRQLLFDLLHMVAVNMRVAQGVHKVTQLQITYLRHHHGQQGIRRDIEWHAEKILTTMNVFITYTYQYQLIRLSLYKIYKNCTKHRLL